jgi:hypothetical protein
MLKFDEFRFILDIPWYDIPSWVRETRNHARVVHTSAWTRALAIGLVNSFPPLCTLLRDLHFFEPIRQLCNCIFQSTGRMQPGDTKELKIGSKQWNDSSEHLRLYPEYTRTHLGVNWKRGHYIFLEWLNVLVRIMINVTQWSVTHFYIFYKSLLPLPEH